VRNARRLTCIGWRYRLRYGVIGHNCAFEPGAGFR
jgi:hypothetical protein